MPNYYKNFSCIASACKHSCCIGWEIDIDEDTCDFYKTVTGELGNRLRSSISFEDEPHFILDKNERCPFLNKDGLCDIIISYGEDGLCDICADHPRFRNSFSDRTEIGLGLCCEAAAEIVLHCAESFSLVLSDDDGEALYSAESEEVELLKKRSEALKIVQDRNLPFEKRTQDLLEHFSAAIPEFSPAKWAEIFTSLERLDKQWDECLKSLEKSDKLLTDIADDIAAENLLCYFLFRHVPSALEYGDISSKIAFAVLSCRIIFTVALTVGLEEAARMYSSEIEYSDENLYILSDYLSQV